MVLAFNKNKNGEKIAPIHLAEVKFCFIEEGLPMSPVASQQTSGNITSGYSEGTSISKISETAQLEENNLPRAQSVAGSDSHQSMSTDMYRMVDDLVTPGVSQRPRPPPNSNETSYGMHSLTAAEVFAPQDVDARPVSRHQGSPTPFPSLPGIYNSPFSPQPGELQTHSPGQSGPATRLSSLQIGSSQQQYAAATAMDQSIGFTSGQRTSWGDHNPSPRLTSSTPQQSVSRMLQASLAQQYTPTPSVFSHPSSLYGGTQWGINGSRPHGDFSHNASTSYAGASEFEIAAMLQSSILNGSQQGWPGSVQTPPNGQG
jgi:hypothetical protein